MHVFRSKNHRITVCISSELSSHAYFEIVNGRCLTIRTSQAVMEVASVNPDLDADWASIAKKYKKSLYKWTIYVYMPNRFWMLPSSPSRLQWGKPGTTPGHLQLHRGGCGGNVVLLKCVYHWHLSTLMIAVILVEKLRILGAATGGIQVEQSLSKMNFNHINQ